MVRTSFGAVAVAGLQLRRPRRGSQSVNGIAIGLILVPRMKNVGTILKLCGGKQKESGVLEWIVLVDEVFS